MVKVEVAYLEPLAYQASFTFHSFLILMVLLKVFMVFNLVTTQAIIHFLLQVMLFQVLFKNVFVYSFNNYLVVLQLSLKLYSLLLRLQALMIFLFPSQNYLYKHKIQFNISLPYFFFGFIILISSVSDRTKFICLSNAKNVPTIILPSIIVTRTL